MQRSLGGYRKTQLKRAVGRFISSDNKTEIILSLQNLKKTFLHYRKVGTLFLCDSLQRKEKLNGII